ncbi:hypothetical protein BKA70DRAFT_1104352, partial [Coprinopsis sp. MPI-PUGE-AT-0042]
MSGLAAVLSSKPKDCPTLTRGEITPEILNDWYNAGKRFLKHNEKITADIVVSYLADAVAEPHLAQWYQTDSERIDKLTLKEYIDEMATLTLRKGWAHNTKQRILHSRQGTVPFKIWQVTVENLNAVLLNLSPKHAFTKDQIRDQLTANCRDTLSAKLDACPLDEDLSFREWSEEMRVPDEDLRSNEALIEAKIGASRNKKSLFDWLSDSKASPPTSASATSTRSSTPTSNTTSTSSTSNTSRAVKLTDDERKLWEEFGGCTRCRQFYAGHRKEECPMLKTNSWPDWNTYKTLTRDMALAAKARHVVGFVGASSAITEDYDAEDDDTYVASNSCIPLTVPHILAPIEASGPSTSDFPRSFTAMPDNACPSIVISGSMVNTLGLRRRPLAKEEDNLSSLTGEMRCQDYVRVEFTSGKGAWSSGVFTAKVCENLPVDILLGMPFLSSRRLVIDPECRTVIQKDTGYDIAHPPTAERKWLPERIPPPPTPPRPKSPPPIAFNDVPAPSLNGSCLPRHLMAAVQERIEALTFQEQMDDLDRRMKTKYKSRFPTHLPPTTDTVPTHIY